MARRVSLPADQVPPPKGSGSRPDLVVAIGASAGGLEACSALLDALTDTTGLAFILIQHLDPSHESLMVDLLTSHTAMTVVQAVDGMRIESGHLYVIPPGGQITIQGDQLSVTSLEPQPGTRLGFDILLPSLAETFGARAVAIVLSGTGADGTAGLADIKKAGGWVIAQTPSEAGFPGMPTSAIESGLVDETLGVADIPKALQSRRQSPADAPATPQPHDLEHCLPRVIDVLKRQTAHDFSLYKHGTLVRRLEQRMGVLGVQITEAETYLARLESDPTEPEQLARLLLINVTRFFRDTEVFEFLAKEVIPGIIAKKHDFDTLRIWTAGCSSGEEAYSLAIIVSEALADSGSRLKLQIFASDADPEAIATAREGLYPLSITDQISAERLERFFTMDAHGYRVTPGLRSAVTFSVQNVLSDPPFSRLDLIACRNLMIYLDRKAQTHVMGLFNFALNQGGILVLGNAETTGTDQGLFEVVSKSSRIYRRKGLPSNVIALSEGGDKADARRSWPAPTDEAISRQAALGDICRRAVADNLAPAAILTDLDLNSLYSTGPVGRYLQVAAGLASHSLLTMVPLPLQAMLRELTRRVLDTRQPASGPGGQTLINGVATEFRIEVQVLDSGGASYLLIGFIDLLPGKACATAPTLPYDLDRVGELEPALAAARSDLAGAVQSLESSAEDHKAIQEEALSINEEHQSTNEELLTSKEELQSLNEELTALNSQLQETLDRQRTTSDDLQNVLYSTDVATLFLDTQLRIRFFTPTTKAFFNVISGDVGRPLSDLNSLAADTTLTADAWKVLKDFEPIEREIETAHGIWFVRRILPYRTHNDGVEGVVITFSDITERKTISKALEVAKQQAELATVAKSRFLAAASHDLRQPLQALALLQGLLVRIVKGDRAQMLLGRLEESVGTMTGMLDTLLDINQIEAGTVHAEMTTFPVAALLERLESEFAYSARSLGLDLRVVHCSLSVTSDMGLLEQMVRNILSNALKYTRSGRILLGCRRHGETLTLEVWDTGIGIPPGELDAVFDEYHQLDNPARERSRGLGLGLSIVQRLGRFLGHAVEVRSSLGKGSVFTVEISASKAPGAPAMGIVSAPAGVRTPTRKVQGTVLLMEDDTEVRDLLTLFLNDEGCEVHAFSDGATALAEVGTGKLHPDLILADYNLPGGHTGLEAANLLQDALGEKIAVVILTGDISTDTLKAIALEPCIQLNKPISLNELSGLLHQILPPADILALAPPEAVTEPHTGVVYVVDDDPLVRHAIATSLESDGRVVETFASSEAFLAAYVPAPDSCLLVDAFLPGMGGLELLASLEASQKSLPTIMITGHSDIALAVAAIKAGARDFIEKPIGLRDLLDAVSRALAVQTGSNSISARQQAARDALSGLTDRQIEIMHMVLRGDPSKNIAADLGINQRTVENHRAAIMKRTGSKSLPALARLAVLADLDELPPAA